MTIANADQIEYWNQASGPKWVAGQALLDELVGPPGAIALTAAAARAGERVLDVGCGCGDQTLALARAVGVGGRVLGLDVSRPMLARARERAVEAGLDWIELREADAQIAKLEREFDLVFSRFGVMFFEDPVAAFRNLRSAVRDEGRLVFVCWQALEHNDWMQVPLRAIAPFVTEVPTFELGAPGPFGLAVPERTERILADAGWRDVTLVSHEVPIRVGAPGAPLRATAELLIRLGPAARVLEPAEAETRERAAHAIEAAVRPYETTAGVHLPGRIWIVSAQ